jgi:hypothetical protein
LVGSGPLQVAIVQQQVPPEDHGHEDSAEVDHGAHEEDSELEEEEEKFGQESYRALK